jgi:hypothetical protein
MFLLWVYVSWYQLALGFRIWIFLSFLSSYIAISELRRPRIMIMLIATILKIS